MLNKAIEKNERFLRVCGKIAKFTGLLLVVFTVYQIVGGIFMVFQSNLPLEYDSFLYLRMYKWIFTILLLLGINQLIKGLLETDFRPNWILKFADKIIYIYAFCLFITFTYITILEWPDQNYKFKWLTTMFFTISMLIKILLWIGLGQVVKRILPIIQESKTLV
jgi:hypothetical protein